MRNKEKELLNSAPAPKAPTVDDLQAKKLQLQIEILEEKKRQEQLKQRQTIQKMNQRTYIKVQPQKRKTSLFYILLLPLGIAFAPFIIIGWILITCTKNVK